MNAFLAFILFYFRCAGGIKLFDCRYLTTQYCNYYFTAFDVIFKNNN